MIYRYKEINEICQDHEYRLSEIQEANQIDLISKLVPIVTLYRIINMALF